MTTSERDLAPTDLARTGLAPADLEATGPPARPPTVPAARAAHLDFVDQLLIAAAEATGEARVRLLNEAVVRFKPMADALAGRYTGRGIPPEDLAQVAALALVKASRGYRPERGSRFAAYAIPTINGELRRHFRDHGWDVRPTRRLQELRMQYRSASIELTHERGRSPSVDEVAEHLGANSQEVREMLVAGEGYSTVSLDAPVESLEGEAPFGDRFGQEDRDLAEVVDRLAIEPLLAALPERQRDVLALRFYAGWTQQQIADELGITQMQVSRLLSRTLRHLHQALDGRA